MIVDCEGTPVSAVDACEEPSRMTPATVRDIDEIKRLLKIPGSERWCTPDKASLIRSMESEADPSDPAPYVSPSDVDLPRIVPGQVWRLSGLGRLEGRLVRVVRLSPPWAHVEIVEPSDDEPCPPILVGILRKWCVLVETAPEVADG